MTAPQRPKVIAFYAYKGGTGRSFTLVHTAWALARAGRRIVLIDLDMSAPSLGALLGRQRARGLVEYLAHWNRRRPLKVQEIVQEVPLDSRASGSLYLVQAGLMDEAYLDSLQGLDWHELVEKAPLGKRPGGRSLFPLSSPFSDLFGELTEYLQPDAILLDAPTGFNDTSNLCLRSLPDLVVAVFSPSRVQLEGIARVLSVLTTDQYSRPATQEDRTPDVYCVASTILLSRLAGSHVRRIGEAFEYLNRVRREAMEQCGNFDGDAAEIASQEPAIVAYDELLADLEWLPTEREPRENHFSVFRDVITYIEGALPLPRPRVTLDGQKKRQLLDDLKPGFGMFAEQEEDLVKSLFLRTRHVEEVQDRRVVVVSGGKGSGKTALFSYLTKSEATRENHLAVHGPGIGLGADLLCSVQDSVPAMDVFWRLYTLSVLIGHYEGSDPDLRRLAATIGQLPHEPLKVQEVIRGIASAPDLEVRVLNAWRELDDTLSRKHTQVALCLDGLDAAFKDDTGRRERGLKSLFTAWQASFSDLKAVSIKVFLRTDLWQNLSFPERSHFLAREMKLTWERRHLWQLVVKRAVHSPAFKNWCQTSMTMPAIQGGSVDSAAETDLLPYLDRLFERHIWAGKNALSTNWILRRLEDGKDAIFPRDLISLVREAIEIESERLKEHQRTTEESVISRQSLSGALEPTSRQRVAALIEEYPDLQPVLERLRGLPARGKLDDHKEPFVEGLIALLSEVGVLRLAEGEYVVPDLYRHGLGMVRPGPR